MIRTTLLAAAGLASLAAAPARADDPRLVSRVYDAGEVVRIEGRTGVQATIAFAEDEHIENVAIGDAAKWQVTPNKRANVLFVKPVAGDARTNLTVMTDRRRYVFDLVASPSARPLYVLQFTYPNDPKPNAVPLAQTATLDPTEQAAIEKAPADPANLNFAWKPSGRAELLPARVYDDGQSTYLSWSASASIPAILVRDDRGAEGPVNYAVRGDTVVVDGVPAIIYLRTGKASAMLENRRPPAAPKPASPAPQTAALASAGAEPAPLTER